MSLDNAAFQLLRSNRLAYVDGLRRNSGFEAGILRLLTQLYPDNAHFIYELLQNAEDAKASHARFSLAKKSLVFEHDGSRLFSARDVESITSIGDSTKADSPTEIGKFGVGFKAVFAYTQTPEISSGEFHFRIRDLVVPELLESSYRGANGFKTKFVFPFNHQKKSRQEAAAEIAVALQGLDDATLLFLSNICRISYVLPDGSKGQLERLLPTSLQQAGSKGEHIEVRIQSPAGEPRSSHWLRYHNVVPIDDDSTRKDCTVSVAFGLEEADGRSGKSGWRVVPRSPGRVCIYFPADKETSNLRFHLHAPFASTVARDSVRDTPGNHQLLAGLAALAAQSMEDIRDRGFLKVAALEALPNNDDNLSTFYVPVRTRIYDAFKLMPLVPTKSGAHGAAKNLFRGPSDIVNLLDDEDLLTLTGGRRSGPLWCANAPQLNQRADKFLDALGIARWGWMELGRVLPYGKIFEESAAPVDIERLIGSKMDSWLLRFYAVLHEATTRHRVGISVEDLALVRVNSKTGVRMVKPSEAFFPLAARAPLPEEVFVVKPEVYNDSSFTGQSQAARQFLEANGVRVFDEAADVARLADTYSRGSFPDRNTHLLHMRRFLAFLKSNPDKADALKGKRIFLGQNPSAQTVLQWCEPGELLLDLPSNPTGLANCSETIGKRLLWSGYEALNLGGAFVEFVGALGVQTDLPIVWSSTNGNPARNQLRADYLQARVRWTDSAKDEDWTITHIDAFVQNPKIESSRLIWTALTSALPKVAKARFRPNQQYAVREADSQLICWLKGNAWIPDANGTFHRPQDISRGQLPPEFRFDDRNGLLSAIGFEEAIKRQSDEFKRKDLLAREFGFDGVEDATAIAKAMHESGMEVKTVLAWFKQHAARPEQPEEKVLSPARRREGVMEHRAYAPERSAVQRERSIQRNLSGVVAEAKAYLRAKYTNANGQMVCQACSNEMPFKFRTGEYYFEAVQVLKRLAKHFFENRLALCPTCAAKYQYARGSTDEDIREAILAVDGEEVGARAAVSVVLAGEPCTVYFVGTHFFDLQVILEKHVATG